MIGGLSLLDKRLTGFQQRANTKSHPHITLIGERNEIYAIPQNKLYVPSETGRLFYADDSFVSLVMGPYGSGKSTMCINKIVRRACSMPFWWNGRRRARWGIVRNTSGELQTTTLKTWLDWFGDLGDVRKRQKPILTY